MRVILVGTPAIRARLRAALGDAGIAVAGEFRSLTEARASSIDADAILLGPAARDEADDEWVEQPLTRRELDVLQLLAEGLTNKSIAARLGIGEQTVKFHVASILSKLGASNRTDAVRLGVRRGLVTL